jgi:hypothetical protein
VRDLVDLVWPRREAPDVPTTTIPPRYPGTPAVAAAEARANLDRQHATFDSLDSKAATMIAAVLVVIGLTLPNLTVHGFFATALVVLLAGVVGYSLATALAAYNVQRVATGGWDPATGMRALGEKQEAATAALAAALFHAIANNRPIVARKARLVRRSLLGLAVAPALLAALFLAGSFGYP